MKKYLLKELQLALSMTGYGRSEINRNGNIVHAEARSVNSRFMDITFRIPRNYSLREKELKDIVREYISRGNVNIVVKIVKDAESAVPLKVNKAAAKSYYRLLNDLRKSIKLRESIKIEHLLTFSEILEPIDDEETTDTLEWELVQEAMRGALENLNTMRAQEGKELMNDLEKRVLWIDEKINEIEKISKERIPEEQKNLHERITLLLDDKFIIDQNRLELEIALLADKLDVTEECVRFRSHNKFFLESLNSKEPPGRKLNFLIQEMNREANTIGSKSNDASLAHFVVGIKEELEKIREQLQNIE